MNKFIQSLKPKNVITFIILLALLISSIVPVVRIFSNKPIVIGEYSYYDLRISEEILEKGLSFKDDLILGGRDYIAKPYHLILAGLLYFFKAEFILVISLVTGLLSVILFYLLLKELKLSLQQRFFTVLILILSPAFVFTFSTVNESCVSIVLFPALYVISLE